MQLTNGEILAANSVFGALFNAKWPIKTAFQLARLGAELTAEAKLINDVRENFIENHGTKDEKTGQFRIMPRIRNEAGEETDNPARTEFMATWAELLSTENTVKLDAKIRLPDGVAVVIEPAVLVALDKFIEEAR